MLYGGKEGVRFCCFRWNWCAEHSLGQLNYVPWLSFWPQKALLQMKFTDLCKLYKAITVLIWALCAVGPRMQKDCEAGKVWFVWWISTMFNSNFTLNGLMSSSQNIGVLWDVKTGISQGHVDHIIHTTGYRKIRAR